MDWRWIRSRFPYHLQSLAKSTEAVTFWRAVPSAQVLLRMLLLWSISGFGLRSVAAWAQRSGWASLSADSLRYRFRNAEGFVTAVLAHVLQHWVRVPKAQGVALRLVDASMLAIAGPSGRCFRLHAVYDPARGAMSSVELTDDKAGEDLQRGPHHPRDVVIADRGLARVPSLVALSLKNVWWIVRATLSSIKLFDAQGQRLDRRATQLCEQAKPGGSAVQFETWLHEGEHRVAARLVIVALPKDKAMLARKKMEQRSRKKRKTPDPTALHLAGYVMLLTTLPQQVASADAVLQWYRVRWQIELFFKRCKSLLNLQIVVSASDELLRVRLLCSMLIAALVDRMNEPALQLEEDRPANLWRWTQLHQLDLLRAISGDVSLAERHQKIEQTERRLRDRPRKRHASHAGRLIQSMQRSLNSQPDRISS